MRIWCIFSGGCTGIEPAGRRYRRGVVGLVGGEWLGAGGEGAHVGGEHEGDAVGEGVWGLGRHEGVRWPRGESVCGELGDGGDVCGGWEGTGDRKSVV